MPPERFVDVYLSEAEFEQLQAIATGPENLAALVEIAGLDGGSVANLIAAQSSEQRRALTTIIGGGSADDRAREWGLVSEDVDRASAEITSIAASVAKMIDHAVLGAMGERLDALLRDADAILRAQGRGFFLGMSWLRVARLADAPRGTTAYMATVLDSTRERIDQLQARIVLLRNANREMPAHLVFLDAKQYSPDDLADLVLTLTTAGSNGPANDVVESLAPVSAEVGVFFGDSLDVWLPTDGQSPHDVITINTVVEWVQRRHDQQMTKPRYLKFYSRLGFVVRMLKWELRTREPVITEGGETGRPALRPELR